MRRRWGRVLGLWALGLALLLAVGAVCWFAVLAVCISISPTFPLSAAPRWHQILLEWVYRAGFYGFGSVDFGWFSLSLPWDGVVFCSWLLAAWLSASAQAAWAPGPLRPRRRHVLAFASGWTLLFLLGWKFLSVDTASQWALSVFIWGGSMAPPGLPDPRLFLAFLALLAAWPLAWALDTDDRLARWAGPPPPSPPFRALRTLITLLFGTLYRVRVMDAGRIPEAGPVLLAANHVSYWDGVFLQIACPRPIRWMIDEAYYRTPGLNLLFRAVGCIPVRTDRVNRGALAAAVEALRTGQVVGIFPEGFLSSTGRMRRLRTGVSVLAARTGSAVVPAYLRGAFAGWPKGQRLPRLSRVEVRFAPPMYLRRRKDLDRPALQGFADGLMRAIKGLYGHGEARHVGHPGGAAWDGAERRGKA